MSDVKPIAPVRIGQTDIVYAQGMRAGSWLFFTGHEATDFENGIAAAVAGKPGLPLGGAPRYLREGRFIFDRLAKLIAAEGGDLRHIVRVDQYYPRAECVNPYQRARKTLLKDYVPPSTSVLMEELLTVGANMNVSLLAVLPGEGREPKAARAEGVPVPQHSGFIASLVCGDYVFVAGQMPNNEAMTGLDPKAYRPPNAVWNGTDIRLQTEFLITGRLKPGLEAGGSSLKNAIKAQVYLTDINDLPEFMDVWNSHFGDNPCALTVVATKGLALLESKIEINIFGVRDNGKIKKADHRSQGLGDHAARPGRGSRRRSIVPVRALCGRRRRRNSGCSATRPACAISALQPNIRCAQSWPPPMKSARAVERHSQMLFARITSSAISMWSIRRCKFGRTNYLVRQSRLAQFARQRRCPFLAVMSLSMYGCISRATDRYSFKSCLLKAGTRL